MLLNRRAMLASVGAFGLGLTSARVLAAPAARNTRFLLVFLRGAYDAANIIAPTGTSFYHEARPSLALAAPNGADPNAALPLDGAWGLHPALKDTMWPLWQAKQLAFLPFAGTDDMSRSHFETQDTIELGQPIAGTRNYGSGFMARLASVLGAGAAASPIHPIAFTGDLPLSFRGGPIVPNVAIAGAAGKPSLDARQSALIASMYRGQKLGPAVNEGFAVRDEVFASITQEMEQAGRGAVSAKGFELAARHVGHLMRGDFNLGFLDVGGWDTHVNQGGATGALAARIGELGRGLAGFIDEIGAEPWANTTIVTISEFGRTFRENGDKGTDHGHGSIYWVLGGGIRGGRMAGPQIDITPQTLNQNRDLPVLTDYRALLGGLLARQYGLSAAQVARVFPGVAGVDLGLV